MLNGACASPAVFGTKKTVISTQLLQDALELLLTMIGLVKVLSVLRTEVPAYTPSSVERWELFKQVELFKQETVYAFGSLYRLGTNEDNPVKYATASCS